MVFGHRSGRMKIECHLVIRAAYKRARDAEPAPGNGSVHMAKEDMFNVVARLDRGTQVARLQQPDTVERRDPDLKRRMVDEEVDGAPI